MSGNQLVDKIENEWNWFCRLLNHEMGSGRIVVEPNCLAWSMLKGGHAINPSAPLNFKLQTKISLEVFRLILKYPGAEEQV